MKFLIAVALLVVGLSPGPGFSQTSEAPTDGSVSVNRVKFSYTYSGVNINIYFNNLIENPFSGDYYSYSYYNPGLSSDVSDDVPCILNQFVFRNTLTNEIFQAEYLGTCNSYDTNHIRIKMNHRDFLRLVVNDFIDTNSTTPLGLEMYTADILGAPFNLQIEPDNAIEFDLRLDLRFNVRIRELDYWTDEGILLIHFNAFIDVATVNASKLSLSLSPYYSQDVSNTVSITGGEILNQSPGLTLSVAIKLTSSDQDLVVSRGIWANGSSIYNSFVVLESGFAVAYYGAEVSLTTRYLVTNIRRAPTDSDPLTVSIQLEYVDGLTLDLVLSLGQSFRVRLDFGERIVSVTCASRNTSQYVNPMLDIDNGAVSIPPNYIQNDWPSSTTLNASRGLAESGLQGYYTCRTEGNTFLSRHLLHSNGYHIYFYEGLSATVDVGEDIVVRFAIGDVDGGGFNLRYSWFNVYYTAGNYRYLSQVYISEIKINTPFPYHAELHIKKTRFSYEGEYFIAIPSINLLHPNFIINVNKPELTLYPPVLTVLSSDPPDTTASLTCTSDNTNVPVLFSGDYASMGITSTYPDDTNSSVRLEFELNESLISMLDGMEFICEARDPENFYSTVSMASSTFREVSDSLSLFAIDPGNNRKQLMDGAMINTNSSFECLWYINPTRTDLETIAGTLFWRLNLEYEEEINVTSDVSSEEYIVTTLENGITLNILGDFFGSVSCIYGYDSVKINVITKVMTVPDYAIPNVVAVEINGFTPSTFTLENQRRFREATADAVNAYCEDKECLVARTRRSTLTADNLYIADITSTGESSISFSLYARVGSGILSGSALAMAVLDHRDEYAALGFNVVPTESTTPILTTSQIIGIAVGGGLGLILLLVVLLITITCCCVKHRSGQPKKGPGDLTNAGTSLDMKPVPYEGLKEQAVGLESEEKERDLDYER